ncbi:AMP-binding protein [Mycolicibacterium moriokaense]|uniref:Crotonobetaine/carnitine-CoA ligase n=1 Tax=Mycolicibacterium moriokaense TaxID=39691 RepID=A0A318HKL4_9MYCO|nr:AMP-binding protein [Mycolicibacterium moriokaense]PXX10941.1 crotonobetaine/carnitine-CoA ligase [Mycolicibacterium moriokaense]
MTEVAAPAAQRAQPRPERVVGELLRAHARLAPRRRFLTCGAAEFGFAALDARTDAVAAGLAAAGVGQGDRVAIVCANRIEMLELFFAVAKLGAVQVPLNAYLKGEFLRYQLADSQASTLVVDASGHTAVAPMLTDLPDLRLLVLLDEPTIDTAAPLIHVRRYSELPVSRPAPVVAVVPSDLMSIVYTSGTTGQPKGCMLSHGYYTRAGRLTGDMLELAADDVLLTALPLFHGAARMLVLTAALVHGLPVVVEPDFRPTTFLARAAETGATIANGVGAMAAALLATPPSQHDRAHRLRAAIFVPLPAAMHTAFTERFGVPTSSELFGQTECVPVTYSPLSGPRSIASCGRPAGDLEVALLDDDDRSVATGTVGEICLRPREPLAMFSGYWNNPEATLATFRTLWHHTGDYGRAGSDGFIFFVDRKKDAVRRRGENVSTMELEGAIALHPAIAEVAAHAVPSEATDDDIKVCVVLADSETIGPAELFGFFKDHLPYFAIPRYVEIVDELPKNAVARVMKHVLRQRPMTDTVWDLQALGFTVARSERR